MTRGTDSLFFTYDTFGYPATLNWDGVLYYYVTNLQGDVIAIQNSSGTIVVQYQYDPWGRLLSITGTMATTLGTLNPLTYRGYVYDHEADLHLLRRTRNIAPQPPVKLWRIFFSGSCVFSYLQISSPVTVAAAS